jgi:hypothetical protein
MKTWTILGTGLCIGLLGACSSSSSNGTTPDSGTHDTGVKKDTGAPKTDGGSPHKDAGKDSAETPDAKAHVDTGVDAGPTRYLLVTYDSTSPTTTFAVDLATGKKVGTITTTDTEAVTDTSNALAPFLLNQTEDVIDKIDPTTWTLGSSWSDPLPIDGGGGGSDSYAVVLASPTAGYVIRYDSNVIDVIDPSQMADAGAVTGSIDLTSLVQANDPYGVVQMQAAVYVGTSQTLYVVLGNTGTYDDYMSNYDTICAGTTSTVVGIDTTTNTVKSLGGSGPGGSIALAGFDPTGAFYDAPNSRIFIVEGGCNPPPTADGGAPGPLQQRGIEAVDLTTNTSKILLDASTKGFPGSFAYVNAHQAVVSFGYPVGTAYNWDPTSTSLASAYPNAPQSFDYDGNRNLVGATITYDSSGNATTDILSMSLDTGTATVLVPNAITVGNGYIGSVGVWPRP